MNTTAKPKVHFVHPYLVNPTNPISVNVIGAGGTGSHLVAALGKVNYALNTLNHAGLQVNVFDHDQVESPNFGRTTFNQNELGFNKAVAAINRNNRTYGTNWKAIPKKYEPDISLPPAQAHVANITISCVDTVKARLAIEKILYAKAENSNRYNRDRAIYWIDFGNSRYSGQLLLSTVGDIKQPESTKYEAVPNLISITKEYPDLLLASEKNDPSPSCSFAEALQQQDLFINGLLAGTGASMIWNMLTKGMTIHRGVFLNIENYRMEPIPIT